MGSIEHCCYRAIGRLLVVTHITNLTAVRIFANTLYIPD
jgi:hypothetical protein